MASPRRPAGSTPTRCAGTGRPSWTSCRPSAARRGCSSARTRTSTTRTAARSCWASPPRGCCARSAAARGRRTSPMPSRPSCAWTSPSRRSSRRRATAPPGEAGHRTVAVRPVAVCPAAVRPVAVCPAAVGRRAVLARRRGVGLPGAMPRDAIRSRGRIRGMRGPMRAATGETPACREPVAIPPRGEVVPARDGSRARTHSDRRRRSAGEAPGDGCPMNRRRTRRTSPSRSPIRSRKPRRDPRRAPAHGPLRSPLRGRTLTPRPPHSLHPHPRRSPLRARHGSAP